jgi:formylglycine-generating enzyme required for sulfatase activity
MALVPPGCFMMGITGEQADYLMSFPSSIMELEDFKDQTSAHEVCFVDAFWIDLTEVTQEQFSRLNGEAKLQSHFQGNELPRERITWMEATNFCEQRGARLPTEAEWEYAARGPDGNLFPWGNAFDCRMGNFDDTEVDDPGLIDGSPNCDGYATTAPVGSLEAGASWVGALDLAGNVWEWVSDRYGMRYYNSQAGGSINPMGPTVGEYRVVRGGAWSINEVDHLSATFRGGIDPAIAIEHLGFRCARSRD